jgi:hypothetical protein
MTQAGRTALKLPVNRSNILPSTGHDDETLALMPSLLRSSTSIDTLSFLPG